MIEFSHRTRRDSLERLGRERFDVLIIGCGIVGAGIARDAAVRGLRVAVVDGGDISGGTSGRTSRLVHGGLRYLERLRIRLVAQAARERDRWVRLAPGLVDPLDFLIPADGPAGAGAWKLRVGLAAYDALSSGTVLPRRRWLKNIRGVEPLLQDTDRGALYSDARADDAVFVLEVARDAHESGAAIATYAPVGGLMIDRGRVAGGIVRDRWGSGDIEARATVVVNAAGPWLDSVRQMAGSREPELRPTKGVHLVVPANRVPVRTALALRTSDRRTVFVVPWGQYSIIGTTDTDHRGDLHGVAASPDDVDYLLAAINRALRTDLRPEDVQMTYASLRPLLASTVQRESDISREHAVWEEPNGLLCVAGGKLTTHRLMARQVVRRILRRLGIPDRGDVTHDRPLRRPPNAAPLKDLGLSRDVIERLARRYPASEVVRYLEPTEARQPITPSSPAVWGELDFALRHELVMTPTDFLVRRSGILYSAADHGESALEAVAERIGAAVGSPPDERDRQCEEYRALVRRSLAFRG